MERARHAGRAALHRLREHRPWAGRVRPCLGAERGQRALSDTRPRPGRRVPGPRTGDGRDVPLASRRPTPERQTIRSGVPRRAAGGSAMAGARCRSLVAVFRHWLTGMHPRWRATTTSSNPVGDAPAPGASLAVAPDDPTLSRLSVRGVLVRAVSRVNRWVRPSTPYATIGPPFSQCEGSKLPCPSSGTLPSLAA